VDNDHGGEKMDIEYRTTIRKNGYDMKDKEGNIITFENEREARIFMDGYENCKAKINPY
jgi:hypothetical protein